MNDSRKEVKVVEIDEELKKTLQSMDDTLKRIETILLCIERKQNSEPAEDFYKKHGIIQTFA